MPKPQNPDSPAYPSSTPSDDDTGPPAEGHAYGALTPDTVLDALASVGLYGDGRLLTLSSYENRVYQVHLESPYDTGTEHCAAVVAKFYRPARWSREQILEEHRFAAELAADDVPMVAPLVLAGDTLNAHAGFLFSVSPRRGGRTPELEDMAVLEWIGRLMARLHNVGARQPFRHRPALDAAQFAREPRDWLLQHDIIPPDASHAWRSAFETALPLIERHAVLGPRPPATGRLRLHGDCHPGNILWTPDQGPHFVDLDDARMGCAVQDLWMLVSGDRRQRTQQWSALLDGYETLRDFDRRELALIEPLRTLRLIHYSAWLARRWDDPAFQANFPWFGSSAYWHGQVQMLHEQIAAMQEEPLHA
ncbi:serine/threonine protein kinase [Comamonas sp. BIGb0124]|uniref:serine/threonine protein kinase n=1 Tax=Comamonas sp. BIGb0124 TaxID=2485130 RepID=UPI000F49DE71|nr:serine/threonine protein kinase [Comamonas sp. BIGb0124]